MTTLDRLIARVRSGPKPIVILSHRRSGTHLTIDLIRKQFAGTSPAMRPFASLSSLYLSIDTLRPGHHAPMTPEQAVDKLARAPHMVVKTHARPDAEGRLPEFEANEPLVQAIIDHAFKINVVRDGRNVVSSQHLYEQGFDPAAHLPTSEFLRTSFFGEPRPAYWATHAMSWKRMPGILTVRFEDIIKSTSETLGRIGDTLGVPPRSVEPLLPIEQPTSKLARALNRALARGETTAIDGRPAPGIKPEKWFNVWTPGDRAYFDLHAGDALIDLGYESDHSWATL